MLLLLLLGVGNVMIIKVNWGKYDRIVYIGKKFLYLVILNKCKVFW